MCDTVSSPKSGTKSEENSTDTLSSETPVSLPSQPPVVLPKLKNSPTSGGKIEKTNPKQSESAPSSGTSTPQNAKARRKSAPRTKKEPAEDSRNRSIAAAPTIAPIAPVAVSGVQGVSPQGPLMLAPAPAGQFMLVQHNGQCFVMPTSQCFGATHSIAPRPPTSSSASSSHPSSTTTNDYLTSSLQRSVHQAAVALAAQHLNSQQRHTQAQQQPTVVRPTIFGSNATLGHVARSLAPKPATTATTVLSPSTSTPVCTQSVTTTVGVAYTTSSTNRRFTPSPPNSSTVQTIPTINVSTQSVAALPTSVPQPTVQPTFFSQGMHLRPQNAPGIVLQMPNGAYTYLQQVYQPSSTVSAVSHQSTVGSFVTQQLATPSCQAAVSSCYKSPIAPSTLLNTVQSVPPPSTSRARPSTNANGTSSTDNANANSTITSNPLPTNVPSCGIPLKATKQNQRTSKTKQGPNSSSKTCITVTNGDGSTSNVTPANLVPVGAPVPMMLMSASGTSFGAPAIPVMGPNGHVIHQQLIPASPLPTQMVPIFHQSHQNQQISLSCNGFPNPSQPICSNLSAQNKTVDEVKSKSADDQQPLNGDVSAENEPPPPLLIRGESKDALDVHVLFMKEAERFSRSIGPSGKLIHRIEGVDIEESNEPFPCDPAWQMSEWMPAELMEEIDLTTPPGASPKSSMSSSLSEVATDVKPKKCNRTSREGGQKSRNQKTPSMSEENDEGESSSEKKRRKPRRKTNELDRLLQMDFGPAQGRLCDILLSSKTPSPVKPKEEKSASKKVEVQPKLETKVEEKVKEAEVEPKVEALLKCVVSVETTTVADVSLNSSNTSNGDLSLGTPINNLSDEELDTERCNYCNGLLRLKRCDNHPQYCSKKCRKLWKKNPVNSEERGAKALTYSPSQTVSSSKPFYPKENIDLPAEASQRTYESSDATSTSLGAMTSSVQQPQRSPPTLTLKMVSPEQAEIVKGQAVAPHGRPSLDDDAIYSKRSPIGQTSPLLKPDSSKKLPSNDFMDKPAKLWTCDEVAAWVQKITGSEDCAKTFRNQDIDGQSLLLLADNPHHNLGTLLGLKLGPVIKIQNALRELAARSCNN